MFLGFTLSIVVGVPAGNELGAVLGWRATLGFIGVMGRWSMRYPWARRLSHVAPFPAVGWVYRAFLKD